MFDFSSEGNPGIPKATEVRRPPWAELDEDPDAGPSAPSSSNSGGSNRPRMQHQPTNGGASLLYKKH